MKGSNPECPCGSGLRYSECCRPIHRGQRASDAPTLMRSRYSAYALGEVDYLWHTLHPDHASRAEGQAAYTAHIRSSRQTLRFARLRVLDHDEAADGQTARVLFHAELYEKGKDRSFLELSTFKRTDAGWRYLSGEARPLRADSKELETLRIPPPP